MKTTDTKKIIIENFIDWYTTNEEERDEMKAEVPIYVKEDHVDEIQQSIGNELKELLSGLWTDANMALDDEWDRSDEGFEAQISLIEEFAGKYGIQLTDNKP